MSLPWFQPISQMLLEAFKSERLAHGLLIDAPHGSGKLAYAYQIVNWLICINRSEADINACGQCKSCQLFNASSFPDFYLLDRLVDNKGKSKQSIGIDQVREVTEKLTRAPQLNGWRIAVIRSVTDLTTAAFNALLKTLEEPGHKTLIILLADNLQQVPATVRSRCQILKPQLPQQPSVDWIMNQSDQFSEIDCIKALNLSANAPLKALELLQTNSIEEAAKISSCLIELFEAKLKVSDAVELLETNVELWTHLARFFSLLVKQLATKEPMKPCFLQLDSKFVFGLYDKVVAYQKAQFAGSNLQSRIQLQAILVQWYEKGRKLTVLSNG